MPMTWEDYLKTHTKKKYEFKLMHDGKEIMKIDDYPSLLTDSDSVYAQCRGIVDNCAIIYRKDIERLGIKRVIINNPATIIIWDDDSKTVVKCKPDETFDPEKGIAMAIVKHVYFQDRTTQANKWFRQQIANNEK